MYCCLMLSNEENRYKNISFLYKLSHYQTIGLLPLKVQSDNMKQMAVASWLAWY